MSLKCNRPQASYATRFQGSNCKWLHKQQHSITSVPELMYALIYCRSSFTNSKSPCVHMTWQGLTCVVSHMVIVGKHILFLASFSLHMHHPLKAGIGGKLAVYTTNTAFIPPTLCLHDLLLHTNLSV